MSIVHFDFVDWTEEDTVTRIYTIVNYIINVSLPSIVNLKVSPTTVNSLCFWVLKRIWWPLCTAFPVFLKRMLNICSQSSTPTEKELHHIHARSSIAMHSRLNSRVRARTVCSYRTYVVSWGFPERSICCERLQLSS